MHHIDVQNCFQNVKKKSCENKYFVDAKELYVKSDRLSENMYTITIQLFQKAFPTKNV